MEPPPTNPLHLFLQFKDVRRSLPAPRTLPRLTAARLRAYGLTAEAAKTFFSRNAAF